MTPRLTDKKPGRQAATSRSNRGASAVRDQIVNLTDEEFAASRAGERERQPRTESLSSRRNVG